MPQKQLIDFGPIICYTISVYNLIYLKKYWVVFKELLILIKTRILVHLRHPSAWHYITKISLRQESAFCLFLPLFVVCVVFFSICYACIVAFKLNWV